MLHETIHNDDIKHNTALQCWNNVATVRKNIVMLRCAKNRCCKSFRVTSVLKGLIQGYNLLFILWNGATYGGKNLN